MNNETRAALSAAVDEAGGILALDAALVARDWIAGGKRLGLPDEQYDVGERGMISERWLASTTHADNATGPADEGISSIRTGSGHRISLAEAVEAAPDRLLGTDYARTHSGLGRLAKIYDFDSRIPFHIHPPLEIAQRVGRNSKDEACYFPSGVPLGPHPESFLGLHPGSSRTEVMAELTDELESWDSDRILAQSQAFLNQPEDGFYVPSGLLHAPGTALTIEIQEDSDTMAMLQGVNDGRLVDKRLLYKDVSDADRDAHGPKAILEWVDWEANLDPYFYSRHHISPVVFAESDEFEEAWILYGSPKFSGKRLVVRPGGSVTTAERGVFSLLAWRGTGTVGGMPVTGGRPDHDELLVVHDRAVEPITYANTGETDLTIIKFFGPDINPDAPRPGTVSHGTLERA
ncbi:hypothetical protein GCM10025867_36880 [Frondihabitans sucicola]|uniref:Mannose-6-phosphate isomerase n=1 Tax=Frondihabitans sucicola TaxID=1268041 RepID=A0ABM8GSJ9_9MICO|nr:hypothetical protein [Frondihabitans sucicola]BDZ51447.1 hypothetical protein GCM10025867_36880 [Frondihabitans sucicola]